MLNEKTFKEVYKIIGSDLYAVIEETGEKRLANDEGCDLLVSTLKAIDISKVAENEYRKAAEDEANKRPGLYELAAGLARIGFCEMKEKRPIKRDLNTGEVIEYSCHKAFCKTQRKGGK